MLERLGRFVDVLFGEGTVTSADPEDLFDISTATMELELGGYERLDRAALCCNRVPSVDFEAVIEDIADMLAASEIESYTDYRVVDDEYGYTWVLLEDPVFDDLVSTIHLASDTLITEGYEQYVLCAVFAFQAEIELYWIYNFKRGAWYPFAPRGEGTRDEALEADAAEKMESYLDLERDEARQYAFWDIPF